MPGRFHGHGGGMWVLNSTGEFRSPRRPNAVRPYSADGLKIMHRSQEKMPRFSGDVDDNKYT
jgi:hypothetical protein